MKTLFLKFKILIILLFILSLQNCKDKEFTSKNKEDYISGYFSARVSGQSVFSWSANTISAVYSNDLLVRGELKESNQYMEFHLPLSPTTAQTYYDVSFVFYINNTSYNITNCSSGFAGITISEKTSSYIQGTFSATVTNSSCYGYSIDSGGFQVYF